MAQSKSDATDAQPAASKEEATSGMAADARGDYPDVPNQPTVSSLKEADKVSGPNIEDAELVDEPVRSNRPDVPVIQTLKVGAGAHTPPTDPHFGPDGRFYPQGEYVDGVFHPHGKDGPSL